MGCCLCTEKDDGSIDSDVLLFSAPNISLKSSISSNHVEDIESQHVISSTEIISKASSAKKMDNLIETYNNLISMEKMVKINQQKMEETSGRKVSMEKDKDLSKLKRKIHQKLNGDEKIHYDEVLEDLKSMRRMIEMKEEGIESLKLQRTTENEAGEMKGKNFASDKQIDMLNEMYENLLAMQKSMEKKEDEIKHLYKEKGDDRVGEDFVALKEKIDMQMREKAVDFDEVYDDLSNLRNLIEIKERRIKTLKLQRDHPKFVPNEE